MSVRSFWVRAWRRADSWHKGSVHRFTQISVDLIWINLGQAMELEKTAYRISDGLNSALGQLGGKAAQWVPNRMILDKLIETGKAFLCNSNPITATNPSWNWTEFTYLLEKDYKLSYDGSDYFQSLTQLLSNWTEVK